MNLKKYQIILDTNVLVAALRSKQGLSEFLQITGEIP
jgi:predicted nucleic acid-binding protein